MSRADERAEARLAELRRLLLCHPIIERRLRALARLRIDARGGSPAQREYMRSLVATETALDGHLAASELDHLARLWWSRRRRGVWGLVRPVGGPERYGRAARRARSVAPGTVQQQVELLAHRLDPEHVVPDSDYRDPSAGRKVRERLRRLAGGH